MSEKTRRGNADVPSSRDAQKPINAKDTVEGSWLTGTGDEESDPLRDEAAERAAKASEPGGERE